MGTPSIDRELLMEILRMLKTSGDYAQPIDILFGYVNGARIDPAAMSTFKAHLMYAVDKGWVDYRADPIDRRRLYYLTRTGETEAARG